MGLALFAFTSTYAIIRYNVNLNGKEPHSNIVMYLLDKGSCWTALWMMVVSPFAGNLLALGSIYQQWSKIGFVQKMVRARERICFYFNKCLTIQYLTPSCHSLFHHFRLPYSALYSWSHQRSCSYLAGYFGLLGGTCTLCSVGLSVLCTLVSRLTSRNYPVHVG